MVIKVLYFKRKVFYYMRLRNIPGAEDAISSSEYCIKNPEEHKGLWQECFPSATAAPYSRLAMGKGLLPYGYGSSTP